MCDHFALFSASSAHLYSPPTIQYQFATKFRGHVEFKHLIKVGMESRACILIFDSAAIYGFMVSVFLAATVIIVGGAATKATQQNMNLSMNRRPTVE
jgi:hypothetical protein